MLGKLRDRCQSYCTGHTGKDRNLNSYVEDTIGMDIGPDNENGSTNSLDTMIVFRGSEAEGHFSDLLSKGQANLYILTREANSLQQ